MACEPRLSQVFLSGLPPVFKVSIRNDASGRWLENSIRFSVNEDDASRAGGEAKLQQAGKALRSAESDWSISRLHGTALKV
jgi:hypothetical protein